MNLSSVGRAALAALLSLCLTACSGPTPQISPSPEPSASAAAPEEAPGLPFDQLEEHGIYRDPDVYAPAARSIVREADWAPPRKQPEREELSYDEVVELLAGRLVTGQMNVIQQCQAVYYYIRDHISYTYMARHTNQEAAAYAGFTSEQGDAYTYAACSKALLEALGFDTRTVQRAGGDLDEPHYWTLVECGGEWYHFDPFPHLLTDPAFPCFLATDQDLLNFNAGAGRDYYAFDGDDYPSRSGGPGDPEAVVPMPDRREDSQETPEPSATPTPQPTAFPEPTPSTAPSPRPTARASAAPSPTAAASLQPTPSPSPTPATSPSPTAAVTPSPEPAHTSAPTPTPEPMAEPGLSQPPVEAVDWEEPVPPPDSLH